MRLRFNIPRRKRVGQMCQSGVLGHLSARAMEQDGRVYSHIQCPFCAWIKIGRYSVCSEGDEYRKYIDLNVGNTLQGHLAGIHHATAASVTVVWVGDR
jgi:hypothetical protein